MAELTKLESKLGEVLGLSMAAREATTKVKAMLDEDDPGDLAELLDRLHEEAGETEQRCTRLAGEFDGKKTAILDQGKETRQKAVEMMENYLEGEDDALDGFEFLTMAEAGEVGHWSIVGKFNEQAQLKNVQELVDWALPIQQRHHKDVLGASLDMAGDEDPDEIEE